MAKDQQWRREGKRRRISEETSTVAEEEEEPLVDQVERITEVPSSQNEKKPGVIFILDKASLKKGVVGRTMKILNSDEDANFLQKQKKNLDDYRPDILYRALLAIFDSPLSKAGMIQAVYVKVDEGVLFEVKPHVRVPRTFKRFCGLMLELLQKSRVTTKDTHEKLLQVIEQPLTRHLPPDSRIIGLSYSSDKMVKLEDYVTTISDDVNLVFVVGAMARGKIDKMDMDDLISVSNYPLSSSRCIGHICDALEDKWNII